MKKSDGLSRAVIMCGISGSGKTFNALRLLSEGYVRLSADALVWQRAGSSLFSLPKEDQQRLFEESREEVKRQLVELLRSGRKVVVDATHCRRSVRDDIRKVCAEAGVKPLFAFCSADKEELWRRLSQREGKGPDDLIVTREALEKYWQGFERPLPDETDFILMDQE